jgi:xanthine dehydrogenase accessory factor
MEVNMDKPTQSQLAAALEKVIAALRGGHALQLDDCLRRAFYCFSPEALDGDPDIRPDDLDMVMTQLTAADLPTFEAALAAVREGRQAWLGFKIVTDPAVVLDSVDTSAWNFNGPGQGSSDVVPGVFFSTDDKEIIFSREPSPRDRRQMLDVTRGPHMHNRQYAGVAWTSLPLEPQGRVFMLGAGDVSVTLEKAAQLCDFDTVAVDDSVEYLNETRFPRSRRALLPGWEVPELAAALAGLEVCEHDYLCVLTRGHARDTEAMLWAAGTPAAYIGMMGNPMKNERVFELGAEAGVAPEVFTAERVHAPIGLRMGGKTPAELAVSIVMQLIQVRNDRRRP